MTTNQAAVCTASATTSIVGEFAFTVENAEELAGNATFKTAMQAAVSTMAGVPVTDVTVEVTASPSRRLDGPDARRLASGTITVKYTIALPTSESQAMIATMKGKSKTSLKTAIMDALTAAGITVANIEVTATPTAEIKSGTADGSPRTHVLMPTTTMAAAMALVMASCSLEQARMA